MRELLTKERKKKKGFTLIELIIVLAIVAIIAAIAIPNFTKVRAESKSKADIQSAETIRRITLTLMAEDKVLPGDTFTVIAGDVSQATIKGEAKNAAGLKEYFKDVKAPQQDLAEDKKNYVVTISKTAASSGGESAVKEDIGNVTVVVGEVTVP
ncbi:prepilin-type N-terminal cleavage/methylation domain-containing protein [Clostridium algidicarnis]|uniref:prepilin-type N-terminal cleavage/methylation domain-containing protein n=1 Tax=Clostridium algidicarnis TaxID=37659 RepID=UPI001C0D8331|nr:prepilin-type N-terminal cleavage/methylation domain-containing protein [Clostridium algidicarnis]MBU3196309.1 prepilin-type N-terminal cleavage/methylation domain-containing protein [Clostridium algidicarnis]